MGYGPGPHTEMGLRGQIAVDTMFPRPEKFYAFCKEEDRENVETVVREISQLATTKEVKVEKRVQTLKALMDFHVVAIDSSKPTFWKRFRRKVFGN